MPQSNNCQVSSVTNLLFLHVTNAGKFPNECELFAPLLNRARGDSRRQAVTAAFFVLKRDN